MSLSREKLAGFTMIELLVAMIVLAVGLLGLAGLNAVSLKHNNSALFRTQATFLAYDLLDRVRANPDTVASYAVALKDVPNATNCVGGSVSCTAAQLASFDVASWKCGLGNFNAETSCTTLGIFGTLPRGDGSVVVNNDVVTVTVQWVETVSSGTEELTSISVSTEI